MYLPYFGDKKNHKYTFFTYINDSWYEDFKLLKFEIKRDGYPDFYRGVVLQSGSKLEVF